MSGSLRDLEVLALDCQASGATPAHGDLLELGWAVCGAGGIVGEVRGTWVLPRTDRRVSRAVRELTGWSEHCLAEALPEQVVWDELARAGAGLGSPTPSVIHFARFELSFLRDLHLRAGGAAPFPLDPLCLHAVATRLLPTLPRRNIRALAGYLGHSPELVRRAAGHVEATAAIWRGLVPLLEDAGIGSWEALRSWLDEPVRTPRARKVFPLARERRRSLPDAPGVYRFVRSNDDVVYVGKATSLKKRVASHFSVARATERALELLTQVHDVRVTVTESILEAALLEADEIKRLDPPYNVHLRAAERHAWFASRDLARAAPAPDAQHPIGPLPSRYAALGLSALSRLVAGEAARPGVCSLVLSVPASGLPARRLFEEGLRAFLSELPVTSSRSPVRRVLEASRTLWLTRGRTELEPVSEDTPPDSWDLARVRRRLERTLVQGGLVLRRARWLRLLAGADVAFREPGMAGVRGLVLTGGSIVARRDLSDVSEVARLPLRRPRALRDRLGPVDAADYDRVRVLATELRRVLDDGGEVAVRLGSHTFTGARLARLIAAV